MEDQDRSTGLPADLEETAEYPLPPPSGVAVVGPTLPGTERILTPEALDFVAGIHRRFDLHRQALLGRRIDRQIELYRTSSADERSEIVGLQPQRSEVILAGACIVRTVIAKLGSDSATVSDGGLRHGLLLDRFG